MPTLIDTIVAVAKGTVPTFDYLNSLAQHTKNLILATPSYAVDVGVANALKIVPYREPQSGDTIQAGQRFDIKVSVTAAAAATTLSVENSAGTVSLTHALKRADGTDPQSGDLIMGQVVSVVFHDAGEWRLSGGGGGGGGGVTDHGALTGLADDDHPQYTLADGSRDFSAIVSYAAHPSITLATQIVDKQYVDDAIVGGGGYTDEQAQDTIASAFALGTHQRITVTYADATNGFDLVVEDDLSLYNNSLSLFLASGDNISTLTNDAGYKTSVTQADVTQHEAALSITESQISDLGDYMPGDLGFVSKTAAFTVSAAEERKEVNCSHSTGFAVTLPSDTTDNLTIGAHGLLTQSGVGAITIAADTGATIEKEATYNAAMAGRYATVYWRKVSANTFRISGELALAP